MATALNSSLARAKAMLATFSAGQKFVGVVLIAALVMAGSVFYRWAATPSYAPLYSGLAGTDPSAVVAKLEADGVPYQLSDTGSTISVPKEQVAAQRIALAGAGLPASEGSEGWGLLDKQPMTSSTFQQQVTYQRALEGELGKTVNAIEGVQTAVVHLSIPTKSVFLDAESKPKASVLLALRPGTELTQPQVQSIVHLVGSSVPELESKDVTVADSAGTLFAAPGLNQGAAGVDSNAQQTNGYEAEEAAKVQAVLDRIVGPGNAVAKVSAVLQFDEVVTETNRVYTDPKAQPRSRTKTVETMDGGTAPATSGILGPDNIAVPNAAAAAGGTGKYGMTTETADSANSNERTVKTVAPGGVLKQSVSVVVDAKASSIDNAKLQTALASAVGIDARRGDTITVTSLPFDTAGATAATAELKKAEAAAKRDVMIGYAKQGLKVLGIVILLLVVSISRRKRKKARSAADLMRLEVVERAQTAAVPVQALERIDLPALEAAPAMPAQRRRDDVLAMVERQPDEVAELLRGWLADRRG